MTKITVLHRFTSGTLLVRLQGSLTLSPSVIELKTRVEGLLSTKPATALVLNLSAVSAIDSAGIGELMKIHTFAIRRGLRLMLTGVNRKIAELLEITRLDGLFAIAPDEASALQQISQPVAQSKVADQP
jgi:anti-sigma B factor antagonist